MLMDMVFGIKIDLKNVIKAVSTDTTLALIIYKIYCTLIKFQAIYGPD